MDLANESVQQRARRLEQVLKRMSESLDDLGLSVKYLLFDLEATKRENHQLRQMLAKRL